MNSRRGLAGNVEGSRRAVFERNVRQPSEGSGPAQAAKIRMGPPDQRQAEEGVGPWGAGRGVRGEWKRRVPASGAARVGEARRDTWVTQSGLRGLSTSEGTADSKSCVRKSVRVRVPPSAPCKNKGLGDSAWPLVSLVQSPNSPVLHQGAITAGDPEGLRGGLQMLSRPYEGDQISPSLTLRSRLCLQRSVRDVTFVASQPSKRNSHDSARSASSLSSIWPTEKSG